MKKATIKRLGISGAAVMLAGALGVTVATADGERPEWVNPDGTVNQQEMPDTFSVLDREGNVVGEASREDIEDPSGGHSARVPVRDANGKLVGHMVRGGDFEPLPSDE